MDRGQASIDDLTGAHERGAGLIELRREVQRARRTQAPLAVAFVDVDHLKAINDSHGHAPGDQKLVEVVDAIRSTLRAYDLVVRVGGDEFLCVFAGLGAEGAAARLSLLNTGLATSPLPVSVTIGVAEMAPDDTPADLIARADGHLYEQRRLARRPTA